MEAKNLMRFPLGKQSSLAPDRERDGSGSFEEAMEGIDPGVRLMYAANEGNIDGIQELLDSGIDINFRDIDNRTALHIAACQGLTEVTSFLLDKGAEVDPKDRWGSTPLADAIYYKNHDVIKLLEKRGAKPLMAPMHVSHAREVPEYEIDPAELDLTDSVQITKGTYRLASWRGIKVAVKMLGEEVLSDESKVKAFRDELDLLQKIRHPNVVQFLGAVTQSSPMMIVTEYLPKGDLREYLKLKGPLKPATAVKFALDIARGMNYLHDNKRAPIIHRDLEPS
ncbi:Integrin-linked protein kinase 1 [Linum perenne]